MIRQKRMVHHHEPGDDCFADADGEVVGGHIMPGCIVRTTAEVVIALLPGWEFRRELDAIPADEREPLRAALITHCSWSAWDSWRTHQRLSVARARAALAAGIAALVAQR